MPSAAPGPKDEPPRAQAPVAQEERSCVEALLVRLRELAPRQSFHELAWNELLACAASLAPLDRAASAAQLARLEEAVHDGREPDRVRGACLLLLGMASPPGWLEERHPLPPPLPPSGSRELERAHALAVALRSRGEPGLPVALGAFESPTGLLTFPAEVNREATGEEVAATLARLRRTLPAPAPDAADGFRSPELQDEVLCREVLVLTGLGPAAGRPGPVQERLFAWLLPADREEACLTHAAQFLLVRAAARSEGVARRLAELLPRLPDAMDRLGLVDAMVRQGLSGAIVLPSLAALLAEEDEDQEIGGALRLLAADLFGSLLSSDDAATREGAFALAFERFLDPREQALVRHALLASLLASDPRAVADAVLLVVDHEDDPKLLGYLADDASLVSSRDPELAFAMLAGLLSRHTLSEADTRIALRHLRALGTTAAADLLLTIARDDPHPTLRLYARELATELGR